MHFTGEGHERADLVTVVLDVFVDRQFPTHGLQPAPDHHHRLGLCVEQRRHEFAEVLHHDLHLLRDVTYQTFVFNGYRP